MAITESYTELAAFLVAVPAIAQADYAASPHTMDGDWAARYYMRNHCDHIHSDADEEAFIATYAAAWNQARIAHPDMRYILAAVHMSPNYLGGGSALLATVAGSLLIQTPKDNAAWQRDRLASGLCTASYTIFESVEAARAEAELLASFKR